ncbi:unnamed protein product [Timema podura]|uniref:BZIP domain-containing protein n=1 Tax=Timema podura TaxID=61482 RepID=A0ABN7NME1_TIMPD|nr:unnamed protein product [Timema podura]
MYSMRILESNSSNNGSTTVLQPSEERMDASSDSAVSSMGSERVPSLSDGEWMETGSDSGHTPGDHYSVDYHSSSKYRPYDYSYTSSRHHSSPTVSIPDTTHRMPPMAQKKHQMYGKRYFQEQATGGTSLGSHGMTPGLPATPVKYEYEETAAVVPTNTFTGPVEGAVGPKPAEIKYSCSVEFMRHHSEPRSSLEHIQHNHTYHLPAESAGSMQRPIARDKHKARRSEEEHLNRDEKRARSMNIPITVQDIINLPMDEFNERLSKYDLSESQLSLIRDIRRRGKNKVAAQNCRKRKLDQIMSLADEVRDMRERKNRLLREREFMLGERQRVKEKFGQLYRHVFQCSINHIQTPTPNPPIFATFWIALNCPGQPQTTSGQRFLSHYPCNKPRCNTSKIHQPSTSFNSRLRQIEYPMKGHYDCSTDNLIYQLQCNYHIAEYIGLTTGTLRPRMNGHNFDTNYNNPDKSSLRDPDGNQYSPYEYSLQQSADGSVLLVPRANTSAIMESEMTHPKHKDYDRHQKE